MVVTILLLLFNIIKAENSFGQLFEKAEVIGGTSFRKANNSFEIGNKIGVFIKTINFKRLFGRIEMSYCDKLIHDSEIEGYYMEIPFLLGYHLKPKEKREKRKLNYFISGISVGRTMINKSIIHYY